MLKSDGEMDRRTNREWKNCLRRTSPDFDKAVRDLRALLERGLSSSFSRRSTSKSFIEDVVQEAVLRIIEKIDTFEGKSHFTTWAMKVAVRVALTELRHRHWKDVSLDKVLEGGGFSSGLMMGEQHYISPEKKAIRKEIMGMLSETIEKDLTENQRNALVAVRFHGMPLSEVARRMGTNRNALYKLLHDARLSLKNAIIRRGLTAGEVLEAFQS